MIRSIYDVSFFTILCILRAAGNNMILLRLSKRIRSHWFGLFFLGKNKAWRVFLVETGDIIDPSVFPVRPPFGTPYRPHRKNWVNMLMSFMANSREIAVIVSESLQMGQGRVWWDLPLLTYTQSDWTCYRLITSPVVISVRSKIQIVPF